MNNVKTDDIFELIFNNAKVKIEKIYPPYKSVKKQLRYYRDDIAAKPRYLFDADAVYFYNYDNKIKTISEENRRQDLAERGDIMTSFWLPLTYYLKLNSHRIIGKNNDNIDNIIHMLEVDQRTKNAFQLIEFLSCNYATRGNLLLLPNSTDECNRRNLNPDKFKVSEDKLDQFLYACLDETLAVYFNRRKDNFITWIFSEHLECMFSPLLFQYSLEDITAGNADINVTKKDIEICNIQSFICDKTRISSYKYMELTDDEWNLYFDRLNKVIAYRNVIQIDSYLPLEWENN